ncbi:hypothetical protein [Algoriphagus sp.]|uniref:hypothetical protein n=1 Tax=Algoriphagus sp. TaxID=1872435 RepID=UPI0025D88E31|nr:hypothetical protein [Algoriphagus sp.]
MSIFPLRVTFLKIIFLILLSNSQVAFAQKNTITSTGPGGGTIEISPIGLRLTMDDFFQRFTRTITESSDSIMRLSQDNSIDKEALIWKINSIPVAQSSIFSRDPFLAYIDIAVFTYQMKLYFEKGAGKELFGEFQFIAIGTLDLLWNDLLTIGRELVPDGDISDGTKLVMDFAEENPISSSYFVRKSTIPLLTEIQDLEKVTFKGLAKDMSESLDDLTSHINSYMEILPKQVRWQTEYLLSNVLTNPDLNQRFDSLSSLFDRMVILAESTPEIIDNQRTAAFVDIKGERIAVLEAIRQERSIILDEIRKERSIVLAELNEQITYQREASFLELNALTNQSIELGFKNLENLVDKIFWRTVVLTSILLIITIIGFIVYKKI